MSIPIDCHNDITFWTLLTGFLEDHQLLAIAYAALLIVNPIRDILIPHVVGKIYNNIKSKGQIMIYIGALVAIIVVVQIMWVLGDQVDVKLYPAVHKYVREQMMAHLFQTRESRYSEVEIGSIITKIIKLPSILYNFIDNIKWTLLPNLVTDIGALIYMFFIDWRIAMPLVGVFGMFLFMLNRSVDTCADPALKRDENYSDLFKNVDDVLRNMITVMSFDKVGDEFDRLNEWEEKFREYSEATLNCSLTAKYVVIPCMLAYVFFVCWFCYGQLKSGAMSGGTFISLLIIIFIVMNSMFDILGSWKDVIMRWGIIDNSLKIFETCDVASAPYTQKASSSDGIIFQDVDFTYVSPDQQREVLHDFNLHIRPKEVTLIVGEIGSGKSTLLHLLLRYQTPQRGEIFLDGVAYTSMPNVEIRQKISYIPQTPVLLNRSIYENIVYGVPNPPDQAGVEALMRDLDLNVFLDSLDQGLNTSVGVHGSKLSGGQRQIVWVLKAILINPEIIIMDEPTAAVDDQTKQIIHYLLETVMVGKTIVMITHDPYLLKFADRIVTMKAGVIVGDERS